MKRVLAALAALLIATAAHASHGKPFPWTRFSEQAADAVNAVP